MYKFLNVEKKGATAIVHFNRKERKNALSQSIMKELTHVAEEISEDSSICSVILTGTLTEFSAGVDLKDSDRWDIDSDNIEANRLASLTGVKMCRAWENIPQITIAAIEGLNVGGGIALSLCCDWRVQAASTRMLLPEAKMGIPLSWQTIPRLVNIVGASKAKKLILLGNEMNSQEALDLGLIDYIEPDGKTLEAAINLANKVNLNSRLVTTLTKQSINNFANALNHLATHMDVDQAVLCGLSSQAKNARANFKK